MAVCMTDAGCDYGAPGGDSSEPVDLTNVDMVAFDAAYAG